MVRAPYCSEMGLKKGPWTPEEDQILIDHIQKHGHGSWRALPKSAGLNRCGKSCRLRWFNYLNPDIKRGNFSEEEERIIIHLHSLLGNKWSKIAVHLPGRTDNEIKNFWNTQLRKKLLQMGIDPKTHKPIPDSNLLVNLSRLLSPSNMINIPIMMNPLVNAYTFQADATNQLSKIQLLHNMLQVVNMSRLPKLEQEEEEANNSNLARLYGQTSEAVEQSTMDHSSQEWFGFINKETMESFEGGFKPEEFLHHRDMNGINCIKTMLPGLVSTTSESSIVNQMNDMTPESNVFEGWEKLVDDEAISSFFKDIVD